MLRPTRKGFYPWFFKGISPLLLASLIMSCNTQANIRGGENTAIAEIENTTSCSVIESRNWHAWIDRVAENEPQLNISGEVDLPTPGYEVVWQPGILDRRSPPNQRISVSFKPPEGIVAQVITPTKVSFTIPSPILEYNSVMIYCGDQLLAEIPGVVPTK